MTSDDKRMPSDGDLASTMLKSLTSLVSPDMQDDYSPRMAGDTRGSRSNNKMHPKITIRWHAENPDAAATQGELELEPPSMLLVGRLPNSDICLSDEQVSRVHAKIYVHDDHVEISDAGSSNGTRLGGRKIERAIWEAGDSVNIGRFVLELEIAREEQTAPHSEPASSYVQSKRTSIDLQVTVTKGNILDCSSEVLVLGLRDQLFASSAVRLVNQKSHKLLSRLKKSGRLDLRTGATSLVPVSQDTLDYDYMLFVGLGELVAPSPEPDRGGFELQLGSRVRSLGFYAFEYMLQFGLDSMGTVLALSKKSDDPAQLAKELIRGCLLAAMRAKDWPNAPEFPTINLCETDHERYEKIVSGLKEEASLLTRQDYRGEQLGSSAQDREISLTIAEDSATPEAADEMETVAIETREPVKLDIRALGPRAADGALEFELSCYRPTEFAYAQTQRSSISETVLQTQIQEIYKRSLDCGSRSGLTASLFDRIIPAQIRQAIEEETRQRPLCLTIDADVAMIPWEALTFDHMPATKRGTSRILRCSGPSGIRPMTTNLRLPINLLLVVNPTGDLPEAEREGDLITKFAERNQGQFKITVLKRDEANKNQLIRALLGVQPDIMHYCGHSEFSREAPKQSGLICAGGEVFTGIDMASVSPMPSILIFNACLSGRLRETYGSCGVNPLEGSAGSVTGIAEAAIYGGVNSLVGTLWQVGDQEAGTFAEKFYDALLDHKTLGDAVALARDAVRLFHPDSFDWANYVLYGDEGLQLLPAEQPRR